MKKLIMLLFLCTLCAFSNTLMAQGPFQELAQKYVSRATECFGDTIENLQEMPVLTPKGVRYLVRNVKITGIVVYWWAGDTIVFSRMLEPQHVWVLKERNNEGGPLDLVPDEECNGILSDKEIVIKDISYVMWYAKCPVE